MIELVFVITLFSLLIWGNVIAFILCSKLLYKPNGLCEKDTREEKELKEIEEPNQEERVFVNPSEQEYIDQEADVLADVREEKLLADKSSDFPSDLESFETSFHERINDLQDELDIRSGSVDLADLSESEREALDKYLLAGVDPGADMRAGVEIITEEYERMMEERKGV